jgi:hypothetical protein
MVTFAAKTQDTSIYETIVSYQFKISNSSTQTIAYDFSSLNSGCYVSGNSGSSGSLDPGQNVTVSCDINGGDADVALTMLQAGAAPLLTLGGQQLQFRFWTHGSQTTNQYINICGTNGFSITEDTDSQNNATGNGFNIGLGGGGGSLTTENICIQVFNAGTSY